MIFGAGVSIRQIIQRALLENKAFKGLTGAMRSAKFVEFLNQDGKFDSDQFRKPLVDAVERGDSAAATSLSQLALLNVAWLDVKNKPGGQIVLYEVQKQLGVQNLDSVLPLINSQLSRYPNVRAQVSNLIRDGWLISLGTITVQGCKFSVFQTATSPMKKQYNPTPTPEAAGA